MKPSFRAFTSPHPFLPVFTLLACTGLAACSATVDNSSTVPPASQAATASPATLTGTVVETMNSGGYTYMRLQSDQKDVWIAATELSVTKGESLTTSLEMPMENFHSTTLDRDFPMIYFVTQVARAGQALQPSPGAGASAMPMASHGGSGAEPQAAAAATVKPTAPPDGGLSIAETWAKRTSLSGKSVTVRGTVVKANNGIMGTNWFHLQDGSGLAADGTNDLTVTSDAQVRVGDVVTVSGTLATKKDFGAGYSYEAILEHATVK